MEIVRLCNASIAYIMPSITLMGNFLINHRGVAPTEELYTGGWRHGYGFQRLFNLCEMRMKWEQKKQWLMGKAFEHTKCVSNSCIYDWYDCLLPRPSHKPSICQVKKKSRASCCTVHEVQWRVWRWRWQHKAISQSEENCRVAAQ